MLIRNKHLPFFEKIAPRRISYRRKRKYYWDDITKYCSYYIHPDSSVLEIGCGTGELLAGLNAKRKVGIDFSANMISSASAQFPEIEFHYMSAEGISIDEKFDVIILSNLVGYLEDVQFVFNQLHRVCHERTKIIITYYNYIWEPLAKLAEWTGIKNRSPVQNWLTPSDIRNLLELSGFETYRTTRRMLFPVYIPIFSEVLNGFAAHLPFFNYFAINIFCFAKILHSKSGKEKEYSVSIVIPARNEKGNIEQAITRLPEFGTWRELIFVEGHSHDNTWEEILRVKEKYAEKDIKAAKQKGVGKADAVRTGFEMATGDLLIILDADLTVPPEDIPKFYEAITNGKGEFINGTRLVYPVEKQAMRILNLIGNRFFSMLFTWLLNVHFKDTLCGTKVLFREDYEKIKKNRAYFGDFDPFGDFDLIFGAHKLNLRIIEQPIRYQNRMYGSTNISRFTHGFLLLKMCIFAARKIKFY